MGFLDYSKRWQAKIDKRLALILGSLDIPDESIRDAILAAKEFSLRSGKRIRPTLMLLSYEMLGGKDDILDIACAYELIHSYFLIHDDIMDETDMRRGMPTVHRIYEKRLGSYNKGVSQAIIIGDTLCAIAYRIIAESRIPQGKKLEVLSLFSRIILDTCYGQIVDFRQEGSDEDKILLIHSYKTSRYTIDGPLSIGSVLAGKKTDFRSISEPLGLLFQIKDDLLDIFSGSTGKDQYKDLREGKNTLHLHYAMKNSTSDVLRRVGNRELSLSECNEIRKIIEDTGGRAYAEERIRQYSEEAERAIMGSILPQEFQSALLELSRFLVERRS